MAVLLVYLYWHFWVNVFFQYLLIYGWNVWIFTKNGYRQDENYDKFENNLKKIWIINNDKEEK
jgi:hypothetical protein